MDRTVKVGIIGCGGIGNGKHLEALKLVKNAEVVAFCDLIIERAQASAKKYGNPNAKIYTDYKKLLADCPEIEIIHVCTPNKSHAEISIAAMEAGKHVMCEKPMAKTAAEAEAMLEASKRTGKKLTIGYQNRQTRQMRLLKKMCEDGVFGDIYFAKALALRRRAVPTWGVFMNEDEQGGGPLIDIGTHSLDLALYMMNNYEVESVLGNCHYKLGKRPNSANSWGPWDPEKFTVEDSAFGFIKMKNGATIILEASWALNIAEPAEATCTLAGTEAGFDTKRATRINGEDLSKLYLETVDLTTKGVDFYESIDNISCGEDSFIDISQWIDAVINDKEPCVKPEQALVVSQILEAIYTSFRTGETVYFN